jgi:predicted house-cleaning noncanonical NTP pyrophosphatase (MazG superfamily)
MKNKLTFHQISKFKPISPITLITDKGELEIPAELITPEIVGEKAFGLSCLPKPWTLPFIVISKEIINILRSSIEEKHLELQNKLVNQIIHTLMNFGIKGEDPIIVRSSGVNEGLAERGNLHSSVGKLKNLIDPLRSSLQLHSTECILRENKLFLIIQLCSNPITLKGHLSNERRCYKELRDWLGEFDGIETSNCEFKINLREWRKKIAVIDQLEAPLKCNLSACVPEVLSVPAAWATEQNVRLHFEWVWDEDTIYIVQADQEDQTIGEDPTELFISDRDSQFKFFPICLNSIDIGHASKYKKIHNVFTYMDLDLPTAKLYILDNQQIINDLASGIVSPALEKDIGELVKGSLVIRMDIATADQDVRQMLPRTNEVRKLNIALAWLKEKSAEIRMLRVHEDVAFIFHNFVPAVASAFAYAAPKKRIVQIEALWGLPEGLYYNSHDKYVVDTKSTNVESLLLNNIKDNNIKKKLSYKHFFVAPDDNGEWATKILASPYDWRPSIQQKNWIKEIAMQSRRITEKEGMPLSIMWFVGVPPSTCPSAIFPWFHEPYDPQIFRRGKSHRTKTPFDKSLVIKTSEDIKRLELEAAKTNSTVRRIRIQPNEDKLLRDKNTLRVIGEIAHKIDAIILLEGGVLSHAYYQLMQTKAIVEVKHPFKDFEEKQEFYKLVRDKVPGNIESGGEFVSKKKLSGEFFLKALRAKLVEESFEVLDAIDKDSIVEELADVTEVVEGILAQLKVTREELDRRQEMKRKKAGGFLNGLVLMETENPYPTKSPNKTDILFDGIYTANTQTVINISEREVIEKSQTISKKWTDRREHKAATESILNLVIPIVRDSWETDTQTITIESNTNKDVGVKAKIIGKRKGSKIQISLSVFTPYTQLKLF